MKNYLNLDKEAFVVCYFISDGKLNVKYDDGSIKSYDYSRLAERMILNDMEENLDRFCNTSNKELLKDNISTCINNSIKMSLGCTLSSLLGLAFTGDDYSLYGLLGCVISSIGCSSLEGIKTYKMLSDKKKYKLYNDNIKLFSTYDLDSDDLCNIYSDTLAKIMFLSGENISINPNTLDCISYKELERIVLLHKAKDSINKLNKIRNRK